MDDPNFERSVILILNHNDEGAFGLVISRPTEVDSFGEDGALDDWITHTSTPSVFFEGGPVQQNSVIGLARFTDDRARKNRALAVIDRLGTKHRKIICV